MAPTPRRALMLIVLGLQALSPLIAETPRRRPVIPAPTTNDFTVNQLEHYLSNDGIAYIRPGLKINVKAVTIGSDRKAVVDLNLTDNFDQPVDRLGKTTPGAISLSFILSWYDPSTRHYTSYITRTETAAPPSPTPGVTAVQATTDSGGAFTDLETGHVKYTFKTALPANFDQTKTHTLGIYSTRNLTDQIGKNYYANVEYDFRPDGAAVTDKWDKINQATSCNNCHDPLSAHGGSRQDVKLCVLCHQPQTTDADTGNTVDFKVMIHKIHRGANLPSVIAGTPYQIIGFRQSVHDFSTVTLPQDIRDCETCHVGSDPKRIPSQSALHKTRPSAAACGSCHDDVNFATGANHPGGAQANDAACARCHVPESGEEFDASVEGGHTIPERSTQLAGLNAAIVSVTNLTPGKKPTVVYKITNNDGSAVDGNKLGLFAPIVAGPTRSYSKLIRENAPGKAAFDAATGTTTYTFSAAIPSDASGTWTVGADAYRNATLKRADGKPDITVRETAFNPIQYVAVTDKSPVPRRTVVNLSQCNTCHDRLALHGGIRRNTEYCVMCHNPTANDSAQRPANLGAPESISFQRLIHRIHTGENLTQDFTVIGFGRSVHNFNDVRFPGDRRNCAKCHAGTSYTLPLPTGIDSVTTLRDYFTPQGPGTAACLACHDGRDAAAHAYLNTVSFPGSTTPAEACATCHGTGKDWDVAKVHAR